MDEHETFLLTLSYVGLGLTAILSITASLTEIRSTAKVRIDRRYAILLHTQVSLGLLIFSLCPRFFAMWLNSANVLMASSLAAAFYISWIFGTHAAPLIYHIRKRSYRKSSHFFKEAAFLLLHEKQRLVFPKNLLWEFLPLTALTALLAIYNGCYVSDWRWYSLLLAYFMFYGLKQFYITLRNSLTQPSKFAPKH